MPSRISYRTQIWASNSPEVPGVVYPQDPWLSRWGTREGSTLIDPHWGAVEYSDRDELLMLVNALGTRVESSQLGTQGGLLESVLEATVQPGCDAVSVSYLVLTDECQQARNYVALAQLRGL